MALATDILIEMARRGAEPVLTGPGLRLSGRDLACVARNMAMHLVQRGIGPGALIALRSDDLAASLGLVFAAGILGCRFGIAGQVEGADIVLDTAPDGEVLPGAFRLDVGWALPPVREAPDRFPNGAAGGAWLVLGGKALADGDLLSRFRADAGVFDRMGMAVAGLGRPDEPEQLILALSVLYHGGILVESAGPAEWRAAGVALVAGRPEVIEHCLAGWAGPPFPVAQLWGGAAQDRARAAFRQVTAAEPLFAAPAPEASPDLDLLDQLFRGIEGVADAISCLVPKPGQPDRLTTFLVLASGADLPRVTSEARIAALRLGGAGAVPQRFLTAESLPRRADGTPDRNACRTLVLTARATGRRGRKQISPPST